MKNYNGVSKVPLGTPALILAHGNNGLLKTNYRFLRLKNSMIKYQKVLKMLST